MTFNFDVTFFFFFQTPFSLYTSDILTFTLDPLPLPFYQSSFFPSISLYSLQFFFYFSTFFFLLFFSSPYSPLYHYLGELTFYGQGR